MLRGALKGTGKRGTRRSRLDTDAKAMIAAAGYENIGVRIAFDYLVRALKGKDPIYNETGIVFWNTKIPELYAMVTEKVLNADVLLQFKWNLIDPQNTNAARRLTFNNNPTGNKNGLTFNGTTQDASMNIRGDQRFTNNEGGFFFYSGNSGTSPGVDIGSGGSAMGSTIWCRYLDNNMYANFKGSGNTTAAVTDGSGLYISSYKNSSFFIMRNGVVLNTSTPTLVNFNTTVNLRIGSDGISAFSTRTCSLGGTHMGLTVAEAQTLTKILNHFQYLIDSALGTNRKKF